MGGLRLKRKKKVFTLRDFVIITVLSVLMVLSPSIRSQLVLKNINKKAEKNDEKYNRKHLSDDKTEYLSVELKDRSILTSSRKLSTSDEINTLNIDINGTKIPEDYLIYEGYVLCKVEFIAMERRNDNGEIYYFQAKPVIGLIEQSKIDDYNKEKDVELCLRHPFLYEAPVLHVYRKVIANITLADYKDYKKEGFVFE